MKTLKEPSDRNPCRSGSLGGLKFMSGMISMCLQDHLSASGLPNANIEQLEVQLALQGQLPV